MITRFKSALDQIKAEDELIANTAEFLNRKLNKNYNKKLSNKVDGRLFQMKKIYAVAMCVAVLLVGGVGGYAYYQTPVTYLSIDINPSIELGINKFEKVVKAEAYNDDGEKVLKGINIKGSDVTLAVNSIINSAVENGYIAEDGTSVVSITSETDNKETAKKVVAQAEAGANEALKENEKTAVIHKDNVALDRRDEARDLGITPGKLNLINKLQAVDSTAKVEDYKDISVKEIMKEINELKKEDKAKNKEKEDVDIEDVDIEKQDIEKQDINKEDVDKINSNKNNSEKNNSNNKNNVNNKNNLNNNINSDEEVENKEKEKEKNEDNSKDKDKIKNNDNSSNRDKTKKTNNNKI